MVHLVGASGSFARNHLDLLGAILVDEQITLDSGVLTLSFASRNVPSVANHKFKIRVIVNAHRNIVVVLNPLFSSDSSISCFCVVYLEGIEELKEDFVFSSLSRDNIGMLLRIINSFNVIEIDVAVIVSVHDVESLHGQVGSKLVHLTTDCSKELIVVDSAGAISVHDSEQSSLIFVVYLKAVVSQEDCTFFFIKVIVFVSISNTESSS